MNFLLKYRFIVLALLIVMGGAVYGIAQQPMVLYSGGSPVTPSTIVTDAATLSRGQSNVLLSDAALFADNGTNYTRLQADGSGNLKVLDTQGTAAANTAGWPVIGGIVARATGSWTSGTAGNTAVSVAVTGYNTVAVFLTQGSTITGGIVTFEASDDNSNWYSVNACRMDTSVCGTSYTLVASTNAPFEIDIGGATNFRVRLSTVISGTGTVGVGVNPQSMPSEPSTTVFQGTSPWVGNTSQMGGVSAASIAADAQSAPTAFSIYNFNMCYNGATWDRCKASGVVDAANNAAAPANVEVIGVEVNSSTQPTAATAGNVRRAIAGLDGVAYVRPGGPVSFTCSATGIAASLTQLTGCAAPGAGLSYYITSIIAQSNTSTAGTFILRYGTAANCGTGTTSIYPAAATTAVGFLPANTVQPLVLTFPTPIKVPANNLVCVLGVATNTTLIDIAGFIAP